MPAGAAIAVLGIAATVYAQLDMGDSWRIGVDPSETTTLVRTAILNGVNPQAWLTDVLERMVTGRVRSTALETLLPWTWRDAQRAAAA